jgi:hypothetical protein
MQHAVVRYANTATVANLGRFRQNLIYSRDRKKRVVSICHGCAPSPKFDNNDIVFHDIFFTLISYCDSVSFVCLQNYYYYYCSCY